MVARRSFMGRVAGFAAFVFGGFTALSAAAENIYQWNGGSASTRDWNAIDNGANTISGGWWKISDWAGIPGITEGTDDQARIVKGGTVVLPEGMKIEGPGSQTASARVKTIYLSLNVNDANALIVRGEITNGVSMTIGGVGGNKGANGRLWVDGGKVTLGGTYANSLVLNGGRATAKGVCTAAVTDGGLLQLTTKSSDIGACCGSGAVLGVTNSTFRTASSILTIGVVPSAITNNMPYADIIAACHDLLDDSYDYARFLAKDSTLDFGSELFLRANSLLAVDGGTLAAANIAPQYWGAFRLTGGATGTVGSIKQPDGMATYGGACDVLIAEGSSLTVTGVSVFGNTAVDAEDGGNWDLVNADERNVAGLTVDNAQATFDGKVTLRAKGRFLADNGATVNLNGDLSLKYGAVAEIGRARVKGWIYGEEGVGRKSVNRIVIREGAEWYPGVGSKTLVGSGSARFEYVQTGGVFSNYNANATSMTVGSPYALLEISGGSFINRSGTGYNNLCPGNGKPYYLRTRGEFLFDVGCIASTQGAGAFNGVNNCIYDHIIDERGLSPLTLSHKGGTPTNESGQYVPGNQRLRPWGGVQVINTNAFALVYHPRTASSDTSFLSTAPDDSLWTTGDLDDTHYWGSTLRPEAAIPLARNGNVYDSGAFAALAMGYCELPPMSTNRLNSVTVQLTLASGSTETVIAGLTEAGYEDAAAAEGVVSFRVPVSRFAGRSGGQKLLIDFTEMPMPEGGMQYNGGALYAYPVVTNATFSAVKVVYDRNLAGTTLILR